LANHKRTARIKKEYRQHKKREKRKNNKKVIAIKKTHLEKDA